MEPIQQVLIDLGEGQTLSIIQGAGFASSPDRGVVEVAVMNKKGTKLLSEPVANLDAKALADYILTYIQDRDLRGLFDEG